MPCAYDLLWELMRAMGRDLHEVAGAEGLTPMQVMLLDRIEDDVAVPMSNLAAQLHCDKSNLTGIVDGLETRGLVERTTPRGDRRVRALVTTEQGREVRGRIGQRLREDNPLLARLEPDALGEFERLVQQLLTPPRSAP
jgi:DNA-binding MarR family transcriptional regulator